MARRKTKTKTKKPPTKTEILGGIAEKTDLPKKQVATVFDELSGVMKKSLKQTGVFTMPGLCKMTVKRKPATKTRKGINPFTGEAITIKAKPASKTVKIRPLANLKQMVA